MDQNRSHQATWLVPIVTATIGLVLAGCVMKQASWINGSWYWFWAYRIPGSLPLLWWSVPMLAAAAPIIVAWFIRPRSRATAVLAIALVMISVFALKLTFMWVFTPPASFAQLAAVVRSPQATSYYSDAAALQNVDGVLSLYPEFMSHANANLHTRSKPPGAVMYYLAFIRAFGFGDRSAIISGIVLGALAACSIPTTYWLTKMFTRDRQTALISATLLALCPGYLFHFPTFDATYPIFVAAMIGFWHLAITRNSLRFAILFGVTLMAATFVTYNLLVLGALLVMLTIRHIVVARTERSHRIRQIVKLTLTGLCTFAACYLVLALTTGFNPIATFRAALLNQREILLRYSDHRPYPATIWFDLVDFALGFGWIILLPVILGIAFLCRRDRDLFWLSIFGIALPILVAIIALLQSETSRVWIFMLPMFLLPAAAELRGWSLAQRVTVFATMLLIALAIGFNMVFLIP
ncbi:MAG: hypothetical protein H7Z14_17725 [Anaerolineae bacterium]|nr:hypothetical protein [Phycisphaerae bacterium]